MQWHQCRLDTQADHQQQEYHFELRMVLGRQAAQCPAFDEGRWPGDHIQPDCTGQQQCAADQGIGQIDTCAAQRVGRATVRDQRVGDQRQQFVEDHKGEQVTGQRQTDGGGDTKTEETEEAAAVRRMFQVTDGIDSGDQPENRRQRDEQY